MWVRTSSGVLGLALTILKIGGFWCPITFRRRKSVLYYAYTFCVFMVILGSYIISQSICLYLMWGNLPLMTGIACVLLTDAVQVLKMATILLRRERIQQLVDEAEMVLTVQRGKEEMKIVKDNERSLRKMALMYVVLTFTTVSSLAASADAGRLPILAWYPYDTRSSPAYELTYTHQIGSIFLSASINMAKDTLVVALISLTGCRFKLVHLQLKTVMDGLQVDRKATLLTGPQESIALKRLRSAVVAHQMALKAAKEIQACFSFPVFIQFSVSLFIICVTAFQMATTRSTMVLVAMFLYLLNMAYQVYIYCYLGNELCELSGSIMLAAYSCPWYLTRALRRCVACVMLRARRPLQLRAGPVTPVTLQTFMAIGKNSYSLFTLLQKVDDDQKQ